VTWPPYDSGSRVSWKTRSVLTVCYSVLQSSGVDVASGTVEMTGVQQCHGLPVIAVVGLVGSVLTVCYSVLQSSGVDVASGTVEVTGVQ
jgi:hypothetical protein